MIHGSFFPESVELQPGEDDQTFPLNLTFWEKERAGYLTIHLRPRVLKQLLEEILLYEVMEYESREKAEELKNV